MTVAIIGAGFTGLSAGLELARLGQRVTIFESSDRVGGLAVGFREENWEWTAERFYHHIFENDDTIIRLSTAVGIPPIFSRPVSAMWWGGRPYPFDGPVELLRFPGLSPLEKIRMGVSLAVMKALPNGTFFERWTTAATLKRLLGQGYDKIWEPLLTGKFDGYAPDVNLAWFWARIKKRTARLGTFPGGFQALADRIAEEIRGKGGTIRLNEKTSSEELRKSYDVVFSTLPEKNQRVSYLDAHILFLELDRPFLTNGIYWLNILDRTFPFLVVVDHTNFVEPVHFSNTHLLYVGNYLPQDHRLFQLSDTAVFQEFFPWLRKIHPEFSKKWVQKSYVFRGPFAQPVMTVNYSKTIPSIRRSNRYYVANQAMIYPWDRGTNYAVELGQRAARTIIEDQGGDRCVIAPYVQNIGF